MRHRPAAMKATPRTFANRELLPSPRVGQSSGAVMRPAMTTALRRTAAIGFLEEKLHMQADTDRPCTRELLYRGVSADGQGRKEYLRRRAGYGIAERYGQPQTEAQVMSLSLRLNPGELRPPSFGKKPIIANTFYRTRGAGGFKEATADS